MFESALAPPGDAGDAGCAGAVGSAEVLAARAVESLAHIETLARDALGLAGAERRGVLATLERVGGALTAARSAWLLAERDAGTSVVAGDPSFEASLARHGRTGLGAATRRVEQAQALAELPAIAVAVRTGALPGEHLEVIGRTLAGASGGVADALRSPDGQQAALRLARAHPAPGFRRALARWVAERDPDRVEDEYQAQRHARYLHVTVRPDGTRISGLVDAVAGERLRRALESTGEVPSDGRTPEQARADALDALASTVLSLPSTASGAAVRPHVSFLVREETFAALRRRRGGARAEGVAGDGAAGEGVVGEGVAGDGAAGEGVAGEVPPATLEDGTPVATSEIARVLCDCELTRIVVDAADEPVNLGRTARLYTGVQRRAVIARDRSCRWGDCDRAARWGEIHHIAWWDRDGGRTDVSNGVLLCSFHHHEVHRYDARIERLTRRPRRRHVDPGPALYRFVAPDGRILAEPRGELPDEVPLGRTPGSARARGVLQAVGQSPPVSTQYRRFGVPPSTSATSSSTPPQRSMVRAEATLSSSQVTSAAATPTDRATASD
ncbi:HNH endonuclease [Cellulomonas chitinilytica]|uniref:HNH endonuclease n=1 Tax=Cellulomonas chitinilytica TaxID=398759 RepID=A0A919TZR1_9CELL|nr:HNH endonuclease [Cellulomonas chitinilytica]